MSLTVENSGDGIDRALLPRLFDRFYRADPARQEGSSEHAGLGAGDHSVNHPRPWRADSLRIG